MKKISLVWLIGLFLVLIFGFAEGQKIKTVDGVTVVSNAKKPNPTKGQPSKVVLTEELTIGGGADPDKSFSQVSTFVVDDEGTIFALDFKDQKIKVFDRAGKYIRSIGKPGQGPGELGMASGIQLTADGTLVVEDATNRRLAQFKPTGEFIKNISTSGKLGLVGILLDGQGNVLGREMGVAEDNTKMFFETKKFDPDLKPLFTLDKIEFPIPIPGSGTKMNVLDLISFYQFGPGGNIYYGRNANYDIKIYNPEGKPIRTIQKEYDPVKVTQKDIDEMLERIPNVAGGANIKDMFSFPDFFPPYQYFLLDDQGRMYVRTYTKGKVKGEYVIDVFDPEGRFISQFISKTDLRLIKADKAYGIEETDEGYQTIKRYAVSME
ncbi:MAG: 6-bladed beta-propeller [Candidatus Aminicenantes bacterium]|nr:6-bladed beta-propeller [Candidatus Aminicenantes bacterium]